ncbi:MAG: PIN domain-containing protein [Candidatus Competibacter sp.]|nr:PIN domain-containing protein [Candidatus Competibacter sp.]MDG4584730.1 PIN domain-containing protein [Candidatus Competibacter sp.]
MPNILLAHNDYGSAVPLGENQVFEAERDLLRQRGHTADAIWITTITLFETRLGLSLLPDGRRRHALETAFAHLLDVELNNRVLPLDSAAAARAALLAAERQRTGRTVDIRDTLIAGIAQARYATLATRNTNSR